MTFTASVNEVDKDFNADYLRSEYLVELGLLLSDQHHYLQIITKLGDEAFSIAQAAEYLKINFKKYEDYLSTKQWSNYFKYEHWPEGCIINTISIFFYDENGDKYEFSDIHQINFSR